MLTVRRLIQGQVRRMFGADGPPPQDLPGDPGLFGPQSVAWRVHGDFTSMMIGGVGALLLQMLHPGALAGVWDHTDFSHDMTARLRGTANFIAATTYGSTPRAMAQIERVRSIHDHVHGLLPDGRPYSANDPALLTWVHAAEVSCFLEAYLRHRDPQLSGADQDRYLAETAVVARLLGAEAVPASRAEAAAYLERMRPELRADYRTREVARALLSQRGQAPAMIPFGQLVFQAARDLLPDWAAAMHGFERPAGGRPGLRATTGAVGAMMRWALNDGAEARARRRVAGTS